ncbi:3-oxoacyl-[acyl-carrier-protein] synthase III C-terminal domain-containing protein [Tepidibacter hydrothermalis]|uniref:3-oxoacyl-[acyl-carrier-protein] synthase III C-terminal domain-containing protein n=1 Tax=Tepidibacter hydrothermalis TaxID=3036126 RepID=A0ABY8EHN9_9FIRM|nr:3-oxoacyl-[acyl-carrier-protein] synthase III C-terminal domain-containing protein [Tepidibacter hydrothermalis]WFD11279.1 3-oxoacyl-[acyl-carrier-protein] synthase III C-terminal domain-containing protein [Tepidibacter hydrothermalis]
MQTYISKPEVGFPKLEIKNNAEMMEILGLQDSRKLRILFKKGGIDKKFSTYNFKENKYNEDMTKMCFKSIKKLFINNKITAKDIDCIITCSNSVDQQLPGLSSRLFSEIDFNKSIHNYPIFGLGCGSFISAINLSKTLLKDDNINNILVVCCEAQAITYLDNLDPNDNGQLMSLTIFGDGASSTLITKDNSFNNNCLQVIDTKISTHYSNSMSMANNKIHLDEKLLENISPHIYKLVSSLLEEHDLKKEDIKHWVMHSGGKKILAGVKKLFDLSDDQMQPSLQVYKEYGNISCASVPVGLNRLCTLSEQKEYIKAPGDLGIVLGFGSGFFLGASLVKYL